MISPVVQGFIVRHAKGSSVLDLSLFHYSRVDVHYEYAQKWVQHKGQHCSTLFPCVTKKFCLKSIKYLRYFDFLNSDLIIPPSHCCLWAKFWLKGDPSWLGAYGSQLLPSIYNFSKLASLQSGHFLVFNFFLTINTFKT